MKLSALVEQLEKAAENALAARETLSRVSATAADRIAAAQADVATAERAYEETVNAAETLKRDLRVGIDEILGDTRVRQ